MNIYIFSVAFFCQILTCNINNKTSLSSTSLKDSTNLETLIVADNFKDKLGRFKLIASSERSSNNIETQSIEVSDPKKSKILKTINIYNENPFFSKSVKSIPNEDLSKFYFVKLPGDGSKSFLDKILNPDVLNLLDTKEKFEKAYVHYNIEQSAENFITLTYTLEIHRDYSEMSGFGFATSNILVFDTVGNEVFNFEVAGGLLSPPNITSDGKYLIMIHSIDPYWNSPQRIGFKIVRLSDRKIVYDTVHDNLTEYLCATWLHSAQNIAGAVLINSIDGELYYLNSAENILYKTKNNIENLYAVVNSFGEFIEVDVTDGQRQKLYINKDFIVINL